MPNKIFVSYKYSDGFVYPLSPHESNTTVRDYVNKLQSILQSENHIYQGENDDESLDDFKDTTIESKLKNKIYSTSLTIIVISKGMKDSAINENDQWIPWEISYSLKEITRENQTSRSNGLIGLILPDKANSTSYFWKRTPCCLSINTPDQFTMMSNNLLNKKNGSWVCQNCRQQHFDHPEGSYIILAEWCEFKDKCNYYIDAALKHRENINDYDICKQPQKHTQIL